MNAEQEFYEKCKNAVIGACITRAPKAARDALKHRRLVSFLQTTAPTLRDVEPSVVPGKILDAVVAELNSISDNNPEASVLYEQTDR